MKGKPKPKREFFECQHCGADVLVGSVACKECGSDASTGWQSAEEIDYQSLDLPGGYSNDEGHPGGSKLPERRSPWFIVLAIVLVVALLAFTVLR